MVDVGVCQDLWFFIHFSLSRIACKGIDFLFASQCTFTCTILSSTPVLLFMIAEEEWSYLNDWEENQLRKKKINE